MNQTCLTHRRILIACPHLDDETLGCGGLLARSAGAGVSVALFSRGSAGKKWADGEYQSYSNDQRFEEFQQALLLLVNGGEWSFDVLYPETGEWHHKLDMLPQLDLVQFLERQIVAFQPDLILTPYAGYDQDHRAVNIATLTCCRPHFYAGSVWEYSVGSEPDFVPDMFVVLTEEQAMKKAEAFRKYNTQAVDAKHPLSEDAVIETLHRHGRFIYEEFAEGYRIVREVWR